MPDPIYGEKACAFLIARDGQMLPSVEELGQYLQAQGWRNSSCPNGSKPATPFRPRVSVSWTVRICAQ
ncbi:hypothetical protein ACTMU2_17330 [Cupriavidus basilensis]